MYNALSTTEQIPLGLAVIFSTLFCFKMIKVVVVLFDKEMAGLLLQVL